MWFLQADKLEPGYDPASAVFAAAEPPADCFAVCVCA